MWNVQCFCIISENIICMYNLPLWLKCSVHTPLILRPVCVICLSVSFEMLKLSMFYQWSIFISKLHSFRRLRNTNYHKVAIFCQFIDKASVLFYFCIFTRIIINYSFILFLFLYESLLHTWKKTFFLLLFLISF